MFKKLKIKICNDYNFKADNHFHSCTVSHSSSYGERDDEIHDGGAAFRHDTFFGNDSCKFPCDVFRLWLNPHALRHYAALHPGCIVLDGNSPLHTSAAASSSTQPAASPTIVVPNSTEDNVAAASNSSNPECFSILWLSFPPAAHKYYRERDIMGSSSTFGPQLRRAHHSKKAKRKMSQKKVKRGRKLRSCTIPKRCDNGEPVSEMIARLEREAAEIRLFFGSGMRSQFEMSGIADFLFDAACDVGELRNYFIHLVSLGSSMRFLHPLVALPTQQEDNILSWMEDALKHYCHCYSKLSTVQIGRNISITDHSIFDDDGYDADNDSSSRARPRRSHSPRSLASVSSKFRKQSKKRRKRRVDFSINDDILMFYIGPKNKLRIKPPGLKTAKAAKAKDEIRHVHTKTHT